MCLLKTVGEAEATYPQSCPKPHYYMLSHIIFKRYLKIEKLFLNIKNRNTEGLCSTDIQREIRS